MAIVVLAVSESWHSKTLYHCILVLGKPECLWVENFILKHTV